MRKPARRRLHRHRVRDGRRKAGLGPSVAPAGAVPDSIGHGVPANQPRCVSFFRASGKRDAQHPTAAALVRRGLQTSPSGGNREKPCPGLPKAGFPRQGAERESAMPELGATHAPGAGQPSPSCLDKHRFGVSSALASALENRHQPTFSE
jgi:hypothetical protein